MTDYRLIQEERWIYIRPYPEPFLLKLLEKTFSYTKKGAEFMPNPLWAQVKLFQKSKSRLPIGLLSKTEELLKTYGFSYEKTVVGSSRLNLIEESEGLYGFQKDALRTFLNANGGILQIPTGGGKTRTAIAAIRTLKRDTLVIVPTLDLVEQWKKQVSKEVHVRTYQGIKSKEFIKRFGLVIFDECHRVACNTIYKIGMNLNENAITLGLSATPFMRDDDNMKVESVLGNVIYKISLRELINEGYLVDAVIHLHKLNGLDSEEFMDYPTVYSNYIDNNSQRNNKIVELARESVGHTLILVNHIEHGNKLFEMLKGEDVIFLNGSSKNRKDSMNHRIIIATSIFDEGIDIPHLKTLIIAGGGKSAIKTTQRIGRVLRTHPGKTSAMVHDFKDNCKWLNQHYLERRAIYEEDFEIVDVQ